MGERGEVVLVWRGLLAAALLMSTPVVAEPEAVAERRPAAPPAEPLSENPEEDAEPGGQRVRLHGRVQARLDADERKDYERKLGIPSARLGLSASLPHVEAELSADLASSTLLKDAFVRLADGSKRLRLHGGQFKAPFLSRTLESTWRLPLLRRGLVEDYLVEQHQLGGRRLGLMGEVRLKEAWGLKVSGGVFEGAEDELGLRTGEDAALRVSVRPLKPLTLGVSTYVAEAFDAARRHAVAAEATLRLKRLELTGEYVTGRLAPGPFHAYLALASYRLPLPGDGWALQPVVGAEMLQLLGDAPAHGYALAGGLNLLLADHFKAQLQAERALRAGDEAPATRYSLQLATRF